MSNNKTKTNIPFSQNSIGIINFDFDSIAEETKDMKSSIKFFHDVSEGKIMLNINITDKYNF